MPKIKSRCLISTLVILWETIYNKGMDDTTPNITFEAAVASARTLADGGIRIALDLPEDSELIMAQLVACKREGIYLRVECTAALPVDTKNDRKHSKF